MSDSTPQPISLPLLPFIVAFVAILALVGGMLTMMIVWGGGNMGMMHHGSAGLDQTPVVSDAAQVTIEMRDLTYFPSKLTVDAGTEIVWINRDALPHNAVADDGAFDSGNMNPEDSWSVTIDEPGVYHYVCTYHAGMEATLTVR